MIVDHCYGGNHINGILDLTDMGKGVRKLLLKWSLQAQWIDYKINEKALHVLKRSFYPPASEASRGVY